MMQWTSEDSSFLLDRLSKVVVLASVAMLSCFIVFGLCFSFFIGTASVFHAVSGKPSERKSGTRQRAETSEVESPLSYDDVIHAKQYLMEG